MNAQTGTHIIASLYGHCCISEKAYEECHYTYVTATGDDIPEHAEGQIPDILVPAVRSLLPSEQPMRFRLHEWPRETTRARGLMCIRAARVLRRAITSSAVTVKRRQPLSLRHARNSTRFGIGRCRRRRRCRRSTSIVVRRLLLPGLWVGHRMLGISRGRSATSDFGVTMTQVDGIVQMLDNRYLFGRRNKSLSRRFGTMGAPLDSVYGPLFSGTPAHMSPGCLQGAKLTSYAAPPALLPNDKAGATKAFQRSFRVERLARAFNPLCDEPPSGARRPISSRTGISTYRTQIPWFPNVVTTDIVTAGKYGALNTIDCLVPNIARSEPNVGPMQDLSAYQTWLAANPVRRFWTYQSCFLPIPAPTGCRGR